MPTTAPHIKEETLNAEPNTIILRLDSYPETFILTHANMTVAGQVEMHAAKPDGSYSMLFEFDDSIKEGDVHHRQVKKIRFMAKQFNGNHDVYSLVESDDFRINIKSIDKDKKSCHLDFQVHLRRGVEDPTLWATGKVNIQGE
jgi:hypothetical protein